MYEGRGWRLEYNLKNLREDILPLHKVISKNHDKMEVRESTSIFFKTERSSKDKGDTSWKQIILLCNI